VAGPSLGRSRTAAFRAGGTALAMASRTIRRCTPNFLATPLIVKQDGTREEFDRDKLIRGIRIACAKRPVPAADIERLVGEIEAALQAMGRLEVPSRVVGDMVMAGLKELDLVAYIRYAIVYLRLDHLGAIRDEINRLLEG
jgi:transcriptional repressor NrdR